MKCMLMSLLFFSQVLTMHDAGSRMLARSQEEESTFALQKIIDAGGWNFNLIKPLIDNGADLNVIKRNQMPLLSMIIEQICSHSDNEQEEIMYYLMLHNANLNIEDGPYGDTPLAYAAWYGSMPIIRFLLTHADTDPFTRNREGKSPIDYVQERTARGRLQNPRLIPLLRKPRKG